MNSFVKDRDEDVACFGAGECDQGIFGEQEMYKGSEKGAVEIRYSRHQVLSSQVVKSFDYIKDCDGGASSRKRGSDAAEYFGATANQWRQCAASIMEDAKAHGTSVFAFNKLCIIVCESMNVGTFGADLMALLLETQRITDVFVHKMGWENDIVYCSQLVMALLELRSDRMTGCIKRCRDLNKKLAKWANANYLAPHWMVLCNIMHAKALELQGMFEAGFKVRLQRVWF